MDVAPRPQTVADYPGASIGRTGGGVKQALATTGGMIAGALVPTAVIGGLASIAIDTKSLHGVGRAAAVGAMILGGLAGAVVGGKLAHDATEGATRTVYTSDAAQSAELLNARPDIAAAMGNPRPREELVSEFADHVFDRLDTSGDGAIQIANEARFHDADGGGVAYDMTEHLHDVDDSEDGVVTKQELISSSMGVGFYSQFSNSSATAKINDPIDGAALEISLRGYGSDVSTDVMDQYMRVRAKPAG